MSNAFLNVCDFCDITVSQGDKIPPCLTPLQISKGSETMHVHWILAKW